MSRQIPHVSLRRLVLLLLVPYLLGTTSAHQDSGIRSIMAKPSPSAGIGRWLQPLAALPSALSEALEDGWVQTNGPMGGRMNTVELQPGNPETVFAGGWGGLFKSTNGGMSWEVLPQFLPASQAVTDLIIHPTNPLVMYALAGPIYRTIDGGQSWAPLDNEHGFFSVAMDPANPRRLLAGMTGVVLLSNDGGTSWTATASLPELPVKDVAFGSGGELWAGTTADPKTGLGFLYHSSDSGASWDSVNLGQSAGTEIHTVFVDPEDRETVYVGLNDIYNEMFNPAADVYLLKSTDGGRSWTPLRLPFTDAMVNVMGRVAGDPTLYVGTGGRVYSSVDGGKNWVYITAAYYTVDPYDIAVDPRNTNVLYLPCRAHGIIKSLDHGNTWTLINNGLLNTQVALFALADSSGSTVYAASMGGAGTFKSTDFGETWTNVTGGGIDHPAADELAVSPTNPQTIWEAVDVGKVFVSRNGGDTWSTTISSYGTGFRCGTVSAMAIAPSTSTRLYALKSGFGIFRSTDAGDTWNFLHQSEVDYTYSLAVHPANPHIVFSGYSPKPFQDFAMVRRSLDGGTTWSTALTVPHSSGITSVAIDPKAPKTIYAASTGASSGGGGVIYHSNDGGDSWSPLNPHFTMLTVWGQPQLIGDPAKPSTAYAATWLGGTWKTVDAGQTWRKLTGAPESSTSLSIDQEDPDIIYATDRASPTLWKSTDGGKTWSHFDFSSSGGFLLNRVLATDHNVYLSTFGPGIHQGKFYVSKDGGTSWTDITGSLPRSVLDIAVDPSNPQVIYITTHIHGAYKSTDGGASWSELRGFPNIGGYDIELDPVAPSVVYAAGMGAATVPDWVMAGGYALTDPSGVYKSTDSGQTWRQLLTTSNECRAIRIHPANHNLLVASALSDGFFVSTDGGANWTGASEGLDTRNLTSLWSAGDKVYAGTQGFGVYAGDIDAANGNVTWVAARSNKPIPDVHSIRVQVDPSNSKRIYVGSNPGGLFRSDDGGNSWFDKNFLTPSVVVDDPKRQGYYTFAINPADPNEVWVGTWGKGVYKSYDGQDFNIGASGGDRILFGKHIDALLFHPTLGLLAATEEGVFRTGDGGSTWKTFSDGLGTPQIRTLNADSDGTVYVGTAGYELYSRRPSDPEWTQVNAFGNWGTLWPTWNNRPMYHFFTLLFHPTDSAVIYFGNFPTGIFKTLDGGNTWREYNVGWLNDGVFSLVFHPRDTNTVYAGTYNGVSRSLDGGLHWEKWNNGWPGEQWVFSIAFDPRDPNVIYACSKNGENEGTGREGFHGTVMRSIDGGASWSPITTSLDLDNEFYRIIVDRISPDTLYLQTQRDGVFISYDRGARWQPWNDGLTNTVAGTNGNNVTNAMALSDDGSQLYFGSAGSGVFRRAITQGSSHETESLSNNLGSKSYVPAKFWRYYAIDVPPAQSFLKVDAASTNGDVDLYLRHSLFPTIEKYDCTSSTRSWSETCNISEPNEGRWYIGVYGSGTGKADFSILATYGITGTRTSLMIPAGGGEASATLGAFSATRAGDAELSVDSGSAPYGTALFSYSQNGVVVSEVGVPASPPTLSARFFVDWRTNVAGNPLNGSSGTISVYTGFAVVNRGTGVANLALRLHDENGNTLGTGTMRVAKGAHLAKFLDQLAPGFVLPASFLGVGLGSMEVTSDQPISILALRSTINQRGEVLLTSTPIADLSMPVQRESSSFPQVVDGGGYQTTLVFLNTSAVEEAGTVRFYDNKGSPLAVRMTSGTSGTQFRYNIPGGGHLHLVTDGSPAGANIGWAQLTPDTGSTSPVGAGIFSLTQNGTLVTESGVPAATPTTHACIFVDKSGGHDTGLAIANPGDSALSVTARAFRADGVTSAGNGPASVAVAALGHDARFVGQIISGLPDGFTGILDLNSPTPFVALTLRSLVNARNEFLIPAFPLADVNKAPPTPLVFPQIADGGGYQTQFVFLNTSGRDSAVQLMFFGEDGQPLMVSQSSGGTSK